MVGLNPKLTEWNVGVQDSMDALTSLITIKAFPLSTQVDTQRMSLLHIIDLSSMTEEISILVLAVHLARWGMSGS